MTVGNGGALEGLPDASLLLLGNNLSGRQLIIDREVRSGLVELIAEGIFSNCKQLSTRPSVGSTRAPRQADASV